MGTRTTIAQPEQSPAPQSTGRQRPAAAPAESLRPSLIAGVLTIDVRHVSRIGLLELMRIGAGMSYRELGARVGLTPTKTRRLLRGQTSRPKRGVTRRMWEVLWDRLPENTAQRAPLHLREEDAREVEHASTAPMLLTEKEAAGLLMLRPQQLRKLVLENPQIGAVKMGRYLRIPRRALCDFVIGPQLAVRQTGYLSIYEAAALLRLSPCQLRYAIKCGRIRVEQTGWHYPIRIPMSEISRLLIEGTHSIPQPKKTPRRKASTAAAKTTPQEPAGASAAGGG